MGKSLDKVLSKTQLGIINVLKTEDNAINISTLKTRLEETGYGNISITQIRDNLEVVKKYGGVRESDAHTFYLSKGLGSGVRNKKTIQNAFHPFRDAYKLGERIYKKYIGAFFIGFGFVVLALQDLSTTGAAISTGNIADFVSIASILLMIIGSALFIKKN